jgi:hypothetical protein
MIALEADDALSPLLLKPAYHPEDTGTVDPTVDVITQKYELAGTPARVTDDLREQVHQGAKLPVNVSYGIG